MLERCLDQLGYADHAALGREGRLRPGIVAWSAARGRSRPWPNAFDLLQEPALRPEPQGIVEPRGEGHPFRNQHSWGICPMELLPPEQQMGALLGQRLVSPPKGVVTRAMFAQTMGLPNEGDPLRAGPETFQAISINPLEALWQAAEAEMKNFLEIRDWHREETLPKMPGPAGEMLLPEPEQRGMHDPSLQGRCLMWEMLGYPSKPSAWPLIEAPRALLGWSDLRREYAGASTS